MSSPLKGVFRSGDETVAFEKLHAVPCSDPHTADVIHQDPNFWVGITEYPDARVEQRLSVPACLARLDTYTGQPFETTVYDVTTLKPSEATWKVDKVLTCLAITLDTNLTDAIEAAGSIRALAGTPTTDVGTIQLIDASQVGDCYHLGQRFFDPTIESVSAYGRVAPCTGLHNGEAFFTDEDHFAAEASPPTSPTLVEQLCIAELERYTGQPYDRSPFNFYYLYPSAATWEFGDRSLVCIGVTLDNSFTDVIDTTGSMRAG